MIGSSSSEGWDCWQMPCTVGSPPQTCFFRRLALVCTHPLTSTNKKRGAGPEFSLSHISTTWSTLLLWIWLEFRIYISNMGSDSAVRNIVKDWDKPLMRWKVILETNLTLNNQIHLCVLGLINWQWSDLTLLPPSSQYKTLHPTRYTNPTTPKHNATHNTQYPITPTYLTIPQYPPPPPRPRTRSQRLPTYHLPKHPIHWCHCSRDHWYIISPKHNLSFETRTNLK